MWKLVDREYMFYNCRIIMYYCERFQKSQARTPTAIARPLICVELAMPVGLGEPVDPPAVPVPVPVPVAFPPVLLVGSPLSFKMA